MPPPRPILALIAAALLTGLGVLAGCTGPARDGVDVVVIGDPHELDTTAGTRFGLPGALVRGATRQGLVRLDETGDLLPGLAERWIVTDDGLSYIFRIRSLELPDGERLNARAVQQSLTRTIRGLKGTTLGLDLSKVRDIRAMTTRVIEVRLNSPMPGLLQLLAQPELGVALPGLPSGPMTMQRDGADAVLTVLPPQARGLPADPEWGEGVQSVRLSVTGAQAALDGFSQGRFEMVLGGTLADLPLVDIGPLSRGTVRLDSALGLFGLDVMNDSGFLQDARNREALAMSLDRAALIEPFNLAGWAPTTRVVAPGLPDDPGLISERWADMDMDARRAEAARRIARWKGENGGALTLSVYLPQGPGSDTLFAGLAEQWGQTGVALTRAERPKDADLAQRDRVARFPGTRWFLNQFNCTVTPAICSPDVDFLVGLAVAAQTIAERQGYLAEAERALANDNIFIPLGEPIRWSLVRSGVQGFAENPWSIHPLFPLARSPI